MSETSSILLVTPGSELGRSFFPTAVAREALQCARTRRGRVGVVERVVLSE
jgi:hypothetical protein